KTSPCSSTSVEPSAGASAMWSRAAMLHVDRATGEPQPTEQVDRWIGAPPTNLKTWPCWSIAVAPSAGVAGPASITAWVVGREDGSHSPPSHVDSHTGAPPTILYIRCVSVVASSVPSASP